MIKTNEYFFKKIYLSLYLKGCVWEGVGDWTKTATYWPPQPLRTSPCVVLVLLGSSTGGLGPSLSGICSHPSIFSSTGLQTNWSPTHWLPVFTELYNCSIAHSIFGMACLIVIKWRCPWCSRYRRRKWTRWYEFKSWMRLIAFHIALIPLGKVWIQ